MSATNHERLGRLNGGRSRQNEEKPADIEKSWKKECTNLIYRDLRGLRVPEEKLSSGSSECPSCKGKRGGQTRGYP